MGLTVSLAGNSLAMGRRPSEAPGNDSEQVRISTGSSANPNSAFKAPELGAPPPPKKAWHSYNQQFQRELRVEQAQEAPKVKPHLGPATPPPEATLPPSQNNLPAGYGTPAFTTPAGFTAPGTSGTAAGLPLPFGSSGTLPGLPAETGPGVSPTGPGFVNQGPPQTSPFPTPSPVPLPNSGIGNPRPNSWAPPPSNTSGQESFPASSGSSAPAAAPSPTR